MVVNLIPVTKDDIEYIKSIYKWNVAEKRKDLYSCEEIDISIDYESFMSFERFYPLFVRTVQSGQVHNYIIADSESNEPLGRLQVFDRNNRNHSLEIGYYFPEEHRGKGYGTAMMKSLLSMYFNSEKLKLNKIIAETAEGNTASNRLLQKFGFKVDARMREHYWFGDEKQDQLIYSILRSDWEGV